MVNEGLLKASLMLVTATEPVLAFWPVIPPVLIPFVQEKVLGRVADTGIMAIDWLQTLSSVGLVMAGLGFTVTTTVLGMPMQVGVLDTVVGVTV